MFSQECVISFVHWGWGVLHGEGVGRADPPRDTTGMHSFLVNNCAVQEMNADVHVLINHPSTRHLAKQLKL